MSKTKVTSVFGTLCVSPCGRFVGRRGETGRVVSIVLATGPNGGVFCTDKLTVDVFNENRAGVMPRRGFDEPAPVPEGGRVQLRRLDEEGMDIRPGPFDPGGGGRGRAQQERKVECVVWIESLDKLPTECPCPHPAIEEAFRWLKEGE
jgi:hypothetical protein